MVNKIRRWPCWTRHYIKTYAFQIDTLHNPESGILTVLAQLAKERGWHLVFNLMSENTDKTEKLVGHDLTYLMRSNQQYWLSFIGEWASWSLTIWTLWDEDYIDQNWTTEHYAQRGRRTIAKILLKGLEQFIPQTIEIHTPLLTPHQIFNDLEGRIGDLFNPQVTGSFQVKFFCLWQRPEYDVFFINTKFTRFAIPSGN